MIRIPLTQGKVALIDNRDAPLARLKWYAQHTNGHWYAARRTREGVIYLHRAVLGKKAGVETDHKDGDGLNCRRYNLRGGTVAQNQMNRGPPRNNTSGYKGVSRFKRTGRWRAVIGVNGRRVYLGSFGTAKEAARAYAKAAKDCIYREGEI